MKVLLLSLAAVVLAACASPGMVEIEKAVHQGAARAAGIAIDPGSVSSGGTGYLPMPCDPSQPATSVCK